MNPIKWEKLTWQAAVFGLLMFTILYGSMLWTCIAGYVDLNTGMVVYHSLTPWAILVYFAFLAILVLFLNEGDKALKKNSQLP